MSSISRDDDLPVWDEQAAAVSTGGDLDLARSLLAGLIEELHTELEQMQRLSADGALPELAEKAHKARGGALYCGVPALVAALEGLERHARAAGGARAAESLAQVAEELRRLQELAP